MKRDPQHGDYMFIRPTPSQNEVVFRPSTETGNDPEQFAADQGWIYEGILVRGYDERQQLRPAAVRHKNGNTFDLGQYLDMEQYILGPEHTPD